MIAIDIRPQAVGSIQSPAGPYSLDTQGKSLEASRIPKCGRKFLLVTPAGPQVKGRSWPKSPPAAGWRQRNGAGDEHASHGSVGLHSRQLIDRGQRPYTSSREAITVFVRHGPNAIPGLECQFLIVTARESHNRNTGFCFSQGLAPKGRETCRQGIGDTNAKTMPAPFRVFCAVNQLVPGAAGCPGEAKPESTQAHRVGQSATGSASPRPSKP